MLFTAYLAGTVTSPIAGGLAARHGRLPVLLVSAGVMTLGALLTLVPSLLVVLAGLLVFTAGFFAAHAVASGWAPVDSPADARAQASSLYYLGYYGGSSLFGWMLGLLVVGGGWPAVVSAAAALVVLAAVLAALLLRSPRPA